MRYTQFKNTQMKDLMIEAEWTNRSPSDSPTTDFYPISRSVSLSRTYAEVLKRRCPEIVNCFGNIYQGRMTLVAEDSVLDKLGLIDLKIAIHNDLEKQRLEKNRGQ